MTFYNRKSRFQKLVYPLYTPEDLEHDPIKNPNLHKLQQIQASANNMNKLKKKPIDRSRNQLHQGVPR